MSGRRRDEAGFALVTVLMLTALMMTLIGAYFVMTHIELGTTRATMEGFRGLYGTEAALNLRSEQLRQTFIGYALPTGSSPSSSTPCAAGDVGSGDLACATHTVDGVGVRSYVAASAANPRLEKIARGELFQNLSSESFRYVVRAGNDDATALELRVDSRRVPLFQFAAFYDKDLELSADEDLLLTGPVHTNGDLYVDAAAGRSAVFSAELSTAGDVFRGQKRADACTTGSVVVADPGAPRAMPACTGARQQLTAAQLADWNGMIRAGVDAVTTPGGGLLQPGGPIWNAADLRVVLDLTATPIVQVRSAASVVDAAATLALGGCTGAAVHSSTLYDRRVGSTIELLDVDLPALLDCIHANDLFGIGIDLDDTSDGGAVVFLSVDGPSAGSVNSYGVRVSNATELRATAVTAPALVGLTIASDQALYVQGHFNRDNKRPAALMADSLNLLSVNWLDTNSCSGCLLSGRLATSTTVNAALLAGTDSTGSAEGPAGRDGGGYNGGLESFPRLHEDWSGATLTLTGSFVSLGTPLHVNAPWASGAPYFAPPTRAWSFDRDFADPTQLPPATPRLTYLRLESNLRRFEL